jgi:hypothetical protein
MSLAAWVKKSDCREEVSASQRATNTMRTALPSSVIARAAATERLLPRASPGAA